MELIPDKGSAPVPVDVFVNVQGGQPPPTPTQAAPAVNVPVPDAGPRPSAGTSPDLIGRAKAAVLSPFGGGEVPPTGDVRDPSFLRESLGSIGNVLLPGSWEDIAMMAAQGIPGAGLARTALRTGASMAAPAAIAAAKGEDSGKAAMSGAVSGVMGAATGGATRAGSRITSNALNRDMPNLARVIGQIIPEFHGNTPAETIARLGNQQGRRALQQTFDAAENAVVAQMPQVVRVPALVQLGVRGPVRGLPDAFEPADALRAMKDAERVLYSRSTGDFTGSVRDAEAVRAARLQFERQIPAAAQPAYDAARQHYSRGMEIIRWYNGGPENLSAAQFNRLVPEGQRMAGRVDFPTLQANFQRQTGDLAGRLSPQQFEALRNALRIEHLMTDVPGRTPSIGISSFGSIPHPYAHGWFHAPQRTGGAERLAGQAAAVGRQLGGRVGAVATEEKPRQR